MDFNNAISLIADILSATGTTIDTKQYDGAIIKKLEASNTLDDGRTTNQTHIAITGAQMDIFPYLRADGYFNDAHSDADLKKYLFLRFQFAFISQTMTTWAEMPQMMVWYLTTESLRERHLLCVASAKTKQTKSRCPSLISIVRILSHFVTCCILEVI